MRKKIIAANWKMNLNCDEAMLLTDSITKSGAGKGISEIIIAAPFIYLHDLVSRIDHHIHFTIAAQNCSAEEKGAYTGEVSAPMLASIGVKQVIIGHSERRSIFNEDDVVIAKKVSMALQFGLTPIFCCGEGGVVRANNFHFDLVEKQISTGLFHLDKAQIANCIIAYEPVWAIGTGINASAAEAQEMHAFIRGKIKDKYSSMVADGISILYGGSVSPKNAVELFSCADVDGGLVGGASLKDSEFLSIIKAMNDL